MVRLEPTNELWALQTLVALFCNAMHHSTTRNQLFAPIIETIDMLWPLATVRIRAHLQLMSKLSFAPKSYLNTYISINQISDSLMITLMGLIANAIAENPRACRALASGVCYLALGRVGGPCM